MSFDYDDWLEERQQKADAERESRELEYEKEYARENEVEDEKPHQK